MSPFSLFESPRLLCDAQLRALCILALLNTVNYSTVGDQFDQITALVLCYIINGIISSLCERGGCTAFKAIV